jgi:dimethylamine monooxygenase subunit B
VIRTIDARVVAVSQPTPTIRQLELRAVAGDLPTFSAGSHVMLHLGGDRPRRNAYSLACSPWSTSSYRLAVRHLPSGRGGSRWVHRELREGDVLTVEPPRNLFPLTRTARHHTLIAGGIGITPFMSHIHQLARDEASFELHYAVRDESEAIFVDELEALCGERLRVYVDPDGAALLGAMSSDVLPSRPLGTHLAICGPAPLMAALTAAAEALGWPAERIHVERFALDQGEQQPFTAADLTTGRRIDVALGQSLLEALEGAGWEVPYLCRQGICGQCRTRVAGGVPDHRDLYLTPEEKAAGDAIMPCVSRALDSPLVLDLPGSPGGEGHAAH